MNGFGYEYCKQQLKKFHELNPSASHQATMDMAGYLASTNLYMKLLEPGSFIPDAQHYLNSTPNGEFALSQL